MALDPRDSAKFPWHMQGGSTVVTKAEAQRRAREILEGQDYRDSLTRRIKSDDLPAAVETMLWYYAYGKPMEEVTLNDRREDLSTLSIEELQKRARMMNDALEEARQLNDALPTAYKVA